MADKKTGKSKKEYKKNKNIKRNSPENTSGKHNGAIIVANGMINDHKKTCKMIMDRFGFSIDDIVISADGGASNTLKMGLIPDVIIGDMDSIKITIREKIRDKSTKTRYISTSSDKDESDTQLAVEYALGLNIESLIIAGATGGRLDHTLANIFLLSSPLLKDIDARIVTDDSDAFILKRSAAIDGIPGKTLTLISLSPYTYFINTRGLKYELKEEKLEFSPVRGLSNEFIKKKAHIDIKEGALLVIREL